MAIYINFNNKSLQIYSKNAQNLKNIKSLNNTSEDEKDTDDVDEQDSTDSEQDFVGQENPESEALDEGESFTESTETKLTQGSLSFDEPNLFKYKLEGMEDLSLGEFADKFKKKDVTVADEVLSEIKTERHLLILPDDFIAKDFVVVPSLSPWKVYQALNTKLAVDYKDLNELACTKKQLMKVKPNSVFGVWISKPELPKSFSEYFSGTGVKIAGINFYSGCLADFYSKHIRGAKNASVIAKISKYQTTIIAIVHGFLVASETLLAGEEDVYRNLSYRHGEYSRRYISHKYICYEVSKISSEDTTKKPERKITRDIIERAYSKTKTNTLAGNFQSRSLQVGELITKKINDMLVFLNECDLKLSDVKVFVDVKNNETFEKLKLADAVKVYYNENDIFKSCHTSKHFKLNPLLLGAKPGRGSLWKK